MLRQFAWEIDALSAQLLDRGFDVVDGERDHRAAIPGRRLRRVQSNPLIARGDLAPVAVMLGDLQPEAVAQNATARCMSDTGSQIALIPWIIEISFEDVDSWSVASRVRPTEVVTGTRRTPS